MLKFLLSLPVLKRLVPSILKKLSFKEISYKYDDIHFNLDLRYLVDRRFFLYDYDAKNIEILKFPDEVLVKLKSTPLILIFFK